MQLTIIDSHSVLTMANLGSKIFKRAERLQSELLGMSVNSSVIRKSCLFRC